MMNSFFSGLCLIILFLAVACSQEVENNSGQKPPNIIFVFTDDHAPHAISAYGSKINRTPHLDRLAEEGMLFRNCFVTNSICAPSRAVILTGKHSHMNSVPTNRETFDTAMVTFPKLLQKAGYQTAMIGKWHLKSEPTGFNYWKVLPGQGSYYNPDFRTPEGEEQIMGYVTDIITDVALEWLQNGRDQEKPFMLMYQHKAPHREWSPGPDHLTMYDGEEIPEPATLFDDYEDNSQAAHMQEMEIDRHMHMWYDLKVKDYPLDTSDNLYKAAEHIRNRMTEEQRAAWDAAYEPKNKELLEANLQGKDLVHWKYQRYIKDYLRCIASVDDNMGRLLDYLEESGLDENTVVIYSSDQGFYLGDHGWFDKRWMYEESFKMPLMVRWPGVIQPGSENTDLVQNLDFAQTFLDMAGVSAPDDMQGASLVPLMKGETPADWRTSVYYRYFEYPGAHMVQQHYGMRNKDYKLIYFYDLDEWEFYNLNKDPDERTNSYGAPEYADVITDMKTELQRLREFYGDTEYEYVAGQ